MSNNNYNNCSIVPFPYCVQCSSVYSFTLQNFTKQSQLCQCKTFQTPNAKWTPVLINKIWYYKMHQESTQFISEQNLTLYFKCPSFSVHHLFQISSYVLQVLSWAPLKAEWPVAVFKGLGESQGLVIHFYTWTKPTNKVINLIALMFT